MEYWNRGSDTALLKWVTGGQNRVQPKNFICRNIWYTMIQSEFINDFCDFLYRRNPSGGILRHWNGSQVVRIGSNLKILYVGTFGIQWFKKSLLMIIVTSYSKPVVFWKYALQVRELPGPKLGVWGPLGSGALPESIGIWITFFGGPLPFWTAVCPLSASLPTGKWKTRTPATFCWSV